MGSKNSFPSKLLSERKLRCYHSSVEEIEKVSSPNDAFFKDVFSEIEHATAFFRSHLPAAIVEKIDWASLTVLPGSFVKSSLQQIHSDLLFSVKIGERESLLYLLFEHQSTVDSSMPLRLLGYLTEIFTAHHKAHGFPLPAVIPFVLHQGPERWSASTAFEDLFQLPEEVATDLLPFLPKFHHALLDLTQFDPLTEKDPRVQILLNLLKSARGPELLRFFKWLATTPAERLPESFLGKILLYAMHCDSDLDAEEIYDILTANPELQKNTMSIAEKLLAKGRKEGRQEGLWIGKIQFLEEVLNLTVSTPAALDALSLEELTERYQSLHHAYEVKFKR
jgi:predicted transposase/invertase (TIGR01784 family)